MNPLWVPVQQCADAGAHALYENLPAFSSFGVASSNFSLYVPTIGPCVPLGSGFSSGWATAYYTVPLSSLSPLVAWDAVHGAVAMTSAPPNINVSRLALSASDCFFDSSDPDAAAMVLVFSPPPSPPRPPPPQPPPVYSSCRGMLAARPSTPSGWYSISVSGSLYNMWCDMTTDGGGYSYYPCQGCTSVSHVTDNDGCKQRGMSVVIPRTQAHWGSIATFITSTMGSNYGTYLSTVPGIYKPYDGRNDCAGGMGVMNYDACNGYNTWRATDGGRWWLRSSGYSEPDGDYNANCYLGDIANIGWNGDTSNIPFNDANCGYSTGNYYICSTNDK